MSRPTKIVKDERVDLTFEPWVKELAKHMAAARGLSVSKYLQALIKDESARRGIKPDDPKIAENLSKWIKHGPPVGDLPQSGKGPGR